MKQSKKAVTEAAKTLGAKGASAGGKARWADVSPEDRSEAMRRAALKRWGKKLKTDDP